jgi:D-alanine-D-alanine ligase
MNKIISKKIFIKNKIKTPKFFSILKEDFNNKRLKKNIIKAKINFPVVVKPYK